ncbi:pimeloyl-ACP methyl ester carboxylesterase [Geodermatophilus bullaregiensis]|uniref:alpha/beta fold hydrolase n=1 Tax=Geodermatophilus bullaregiensis TaxID=1564160 RepID=UPI00195EB825|nr:alpha/beta fold hydrolase [Geodermatophilus bullaregiensis]MBM7804405.1 pimeloyl-ACP methyl ester carboxylesterase [Geodermatophilus bullaregiensis]
MRSLQVTAPDGTPIRAWSAGRGTPVLLCNGLGASPSAWPALVSEDSGFQVVGWDHRGLGASRRPRDPGAVQVEDHVGDARAVLDAFGLPAVTVVGWSLGVNVAFELALEDPGRVDGVLAVAGVPGGSFSSLFGPFGVPRRLRAPVGRLSSRLLPVVGPLLPVLTRGLQPWQTVLAPAVAGRSTAEAARLQALAAVVGEFARHDWGWFRHLAVAVADHAPLDLSPLSCPVTFLAGRYDTLVDVADVRAAAAAVPGARYREFAATHFLPLEAPRAMLDEVRRLTATRALRV